MYAIVSPMISACSGFTRTRPRGVSSGTEYQRQRSRSMMIVIPASRATPSNTQPLRREPTWKSSHAAKTRTRGSTKRRCAHPVLGKSARKSSAAKAATVRADRRTRGASRPRSARDAPGEKDHRAGGGHGAEEPEVLLASDTEAQEQADGKEARRPEPLGVDQQQADDAQHEQHRHRRVVEHGEDGKSPHDEEGVEHCR